MNNYIKLFPELYYLHHYVGRFQSSHIITAVSIFSHCVNFVMRNCFSSPVVLYFPALFLFVYLLPFFFVFCFVCGDLSCPSLWLGITFSFSSPFQPPQHFGSGTVTSIGLADMNLDLSLSDHSASDSGNKTMVNNRKFYRSPRLASTWVCSLGAASQEIACSHPAS